MYSNWDQQYQIYPFTLPLFIRSKKQKEIKLKSTVYVNFLSFAGNNESPLTEGEEEKKKRPKPLTK